MTAQISDKVIYKEETYSICGVSGEGLFDPGQKGQNPVTLHTGCWRGFFVTYLLDEQKLLLKDYVIGVTKKTWPKFEAKVEAVTYRDLNELVPFSGGILLGGNFLQDLYVHMGFHPAWKYENVLEVILDKGLVVNIFDRSEQMAERRKHLTERPLQPSSTDMDEIEKWVEHCFALEY